MNCGNRIGIVAMVVGLAAPALCFGKTVAEIEKDLRASLDKMKSYSAKVNSVTDMDQGGMKMSMRMSGIYEVLKVGEKLMFRMEGKTKMDMPGMENAPGAGEQDILVISDGDFTYQLSSAMGRKNANKSKADTEIVPWGAMRESHVLKALPDEKIDAQDCYVVEAKAKTTGPMQADRIVFHCRKDIGCTIKQVAYAADGTPINTLTFTDIKINPKLDPERFKFVAPEGVTVMDRTGN